MSERDDDTPESAGINGDSEVEGEYSKPDMETLGSLAAIGSLFISDGNDDMSSTPGFGWHDDGGYDDDHDWCFITTATAGEQELGELRYFRDEVLAESLSGRGLLRLYYKISPPIAGTLHRNPDSTTENVVRSLVKKCSGLANNRKHQSGLLATFISIYLTALYIFGVCIAIMGHTLIRAKDGFNALKIRGP